MKVNDIQIVLNKLENKIFQDNLEIDHIILGKNTIPNLYVRISGWNMRSGYYPVIIKEGDQITIISTKQKQFEDEMKDIINESN